MSPEPKRRAEALTLNLIHGARALLHVADRIAAMNVESDSAGVTRWQEIGTRLDQLTRPPALQ